MNTRSPEELVKDERAALVATLKDSALDAPTLCEGWKAQHLAAHLLLREDQPTIAAGIVLPPLAERTERKTVELAEALDSQRKYESVIDSFAGLPGPLGIRNRQPRLDAAMNVVEYFVHIEDVRRAQEDWEPREVGQDEQNFLWQMLIKRAKMLAGKHFPQGLILRAPGYTPAEKTVIKGKNPQLPATVLTGEPGELLLYLFGRSDYARVSIG